VLGAALAIVVVITVYTLVFSFLNTTTLLPTGTSIDVAAGSFYSLKTTPNTTTLLDGSYTANSNLAFYVMNQTQYSHKFLSLLNNGSTQDIHASYYAAYGGYGLTGTATITGAYTASGTVTLYIMNETQHSDFYNSNGTKISYDYQTSGTQQTLSTTLEVGLYFLIFYPQSNTTNTLLTITQTFTAVYTAPTTYLYTSNTMQNSLSLTLPKGIYYLVWYNPNPTLTIRVTVTESITARTRIFG
jgi:hypothetical protein